MPRKRLGLALGLGLGSVLGSAPVPARVASSASSAAGLDGRALQHLDRALAAVNLSLADLAWDKRPHEDPYRLPIVNRALDRPLDLALLAEQAELDFDGDPLEGALAAARWLSVAPAAPPAPALTPTAESQFVGAPAAVRPLLARLVDAHRLALLRSRRALAALSPEERALLVESGGRIYTDESEEDWDMSPILAAARKVDLAELAAAALELARSAMELRELAAGLGTDDIRAARWSIDGLSVALGSSGDDRHAASVVLDPGGDDVYTAGSVILDLAGNDRYRELAGRALVETALLIDLSGADDYAGGDFTQGGAGYGVSLLLDVEGDDRYRAGQCAQGAGVFGIGLLLDLGGSDSYRGERFVQGFGGTRGLGALSDRAGNDTYYAGGRYSHAPLLPESYQSLSQGFAIGLRSASASGGIGILADHEGNDIYSAEVFGQGASYWYSLGMLIDSAGFDKYDLYQYGQGAGIHLSAGVLLDRAGNDGYTCNNGVAQGSGHDWGVGLLWDRAGNDAYQGSGMSQGGANANGLGMLFDEAGNDSYAGWNVKNQGDAFFARGTIGGGVLLDLGGQDRYTHGGADDALWTRGTVGVGYDVGEPKVVAP